MKAIPKDELVILINSLDSDIVFAPTIDRLFDRYADEYYKDYGCSPFELTCVNPLRKDRIEELSKEDNDGQ